jgi:hypothetical protein
MFQGPRLFEIDLHSHHREGILEVLADHKAG